MTNSLGAYVHGNGPALEGWAWSTLSSLGSPRDLLATYLFLVLTFVSFLREWPWTARALLLLMTLFPLAGGVPLAMSRYVLAAWPGFGVASDLLERTPAWLRGVVVAGLATVSVFMLHDLSRGFYVG